MSARRRAVDWAPQLHDEEETDKGRETDAIAEEKDAEAGPEEYHENGGSGRMDKQALAKEAAGMVPCIDHNS